MPYTLLGRHSTGEPRALKHLTCSKEACHETALQHYSIGEGQQKMAFQSLSCPVSENHQHVGSNELGMETDFGNKKGEADCMMQIH